MPTWGGGNDTHLCVTSMKDWTSQDAPTKPNKTMPDRLKCDENLLQARG